MRKGGIYSPGVDDTAEDERSARRSTGSGWGPLGPAHRAGASELRRRGHHARRSSRRSSRHSRTSRWRRRAANVELGVLPAAIGAAVETAAAEVARGEHAAEFPLPVLQGGGGTSTNMNLNEVIAHRAGELLGAERAPARSRQSLTVDERRLPDGTRARDDRDRPTLPGGHRCAGSGRPSSRQAHGVARAPRKDLPAGRGAGSGRSGTAGCRERARTHPRRSRASARRPLSSPARCNRRRHRHRRAPRLPRGRRSPSRRAAPGRGGNRRPLRRSSAPRRVCRGRERARPGLSRRIEARGRSPPPLVGAARRAGRGSPPGRAGRLDDHAREGQPGHPGARTPGRLRSRGRPAGRRALPPARGSSSST